MSITLLEGGERPGEKDGTHIGTCSHRLAVTPQARMQGILGVT
jgi:hypothetical protein